MRLKFLEKLFIAIFVFIIFLSMYTKWQIDLEKQDYIYFSFHLEALIGNLMVHILFDLKLIIMYVVIM